MFKDFKGWYQGVMRNMSRMCVSLKEQRTRSAGMTAVDTTAREVIIAQQAQIEALQRAVTLLLSIEGIPNSLLRHVGKALEIQEPTFGDEPDTEVEDEKEGDEYDNWRWKMDRLSGLFGTSVFDKANVSFRQSPDHINPDAVFIKKIKNEREYTLLHEWARNYLGSLNTGGGQKPDGYWVRLDHKALVDRYLEFPNRETNGPESTDTDRLSSKLKALLELFPAASEIQIRQALTVLNMETE